MFKAPERCELAVFSEHPMDPERSLVRQRRQVAGECARSDHISFVVDDLGICVKQFEEFLGLLCRKEIGIFLDQKARHNDQPGPESYLGKEILKDSDIKGKQSMEEARKNEQPHDSSCLFIIPCFVPC